MSIPSVLLVLALLVLPRGSAIAQQAGGHAVHGTRDGAARTLPAESGQDAYAAIAEIVAMLEADSTTDWSRVDLEALRQHLIDMNDVTLRSAVTPRDVPRGLRMDVTGTSRTTAAIRRMLHAHAAQLASTSTYVASAEDIPGGARLTVTARDTGDARVIAKIRGLGFIGLLTSENHHAAHHLMIARGNGHH